MHLMHQSFDVGHCGSGLLQKRIRNPTKFLVRSKPCRSWDFRNIVLYRLAQLNSTQILSGLFGFTTGWWGKYHATRTVCSNEVLSTICACPFSKMLSINASNGRSGFVSNLLCSNSKQCSAIAGLFGKQGTSSFQARVSLSGSDPPSSRSTIS